MKYFIVHSNDVNRCQYVVAVLKGKGFIIGDKTKSFSNMIRRKIESIKNKKIYLPGLYIPVEMFDLLEKEPLQELDNVMFYTVKGSFKLNHARYAETEWKQLATKIWPMTNNCETLSIP